MKGFKTSNEKSAIIKKIGNNIYVLVLKICCRCLGAEMPLKQQKNTTMTQKQIRSLFSVYLWLCMSVCVKKNSLCSAWWLFANVSYCICLIPHVGQLCFINSAGRIQMCNCSTSADFTGSVPALLLLIYVNSNSKIDFHYKHSSSGTHYSI